MKEQNGKIMSMEDWNYIYRRDSHWTDIFSTCTISEFDCGYICTRVLRVWAYVLTLPLAIIFEFLYCLWDGGLRGWRFPTRPIEKWAGYKSDVGLNGQYDRMKKVWERA